MTAIDIIVVLIAQTKGHLVNTDGNLEFPEEFIATGLSGPRGLATGLVKDVVTLKMHQTTFQFFLIGSSGIASR